MKRQICQSCGREMLRPEAHGTARDGTRIRDYCIEC